MSPHHTQKVKNKTHPNHPFPHPSHSQTQDKHNNELPWKIWCFFFFFLRQGKSDAFTLKPLLVFSSFLVLFLVSIYHLSCKKWLYLKLEKSIWLSFLIKICSELLICTFLVLKELFLFIFIHYGIHNTFTK